MGDELFPVGTRVVLHGLQRAQHLNGHVGVVAGHDRDEARYNVKLDAIAPGEPDDAEQLIALGANKMVKPVNLDREPFPKDADFSVIPCADTSSNVTSLIHQIASYINSDKGKHHVESLFEQKVKGIRRAPSGENLWLTIEKTKDNSTMAVDDVFEAVLQEQMDGNYQTPKGMRDALVSYIKEQAQGKGDALSNFDNFTLCISLGKVGSELVHSSLPKGYVELGLCLTEKTPATMVYKSDDPIEKPEDMKKIFPGLSDEAFQTMAQNDEVCKLLKNHGHVMSGEQTLLNPGASLSMGQISVVKGGLLYAEPAHEEDDQSARIMIYASATVSQKILIAQSFP